MLLVSTEGFRLKMTEEVLLFGLVVDKNWLAVILVDLIMHYKLTLLCSEALVASSLKNEKNASLRPKNS